MARESDVLVQRLTEVTRTRHLRFGNTIFHLEPNLKDGPGGLRDTHVAHGWQRSRRSIPDASGRNRWVQEHSEDDEVLEAVEFLSATRCYLHYRGKRDDNVINWDAQDETRGARHRNPGGA